MVGEAAQGDPLPPALLGLPHGVRGLGPGLRGGQVRPAQGHEDVVALGQPRACPGLATLQAQPQVGGELEGRMVPLVRRGHRDGLAIDVPGVLPARAAAVVVEGRLAAQGQLDRAGDAAHRAQQDVPGIPVGGGALVGAGAVVGVVPRAHDQGGADDDPARLRLPRGLHHEAARHVATRRGDPHAVGREGEVPRRAVEDRAEHAGGVRPRQAHPLHRPVGRDETRRLAVGEERVVRDRRERAAPHRDRARAEGADRGQRRAPREVGHRQRVKTILPTHRL